MVHFCKNQLVASGVAYYLMATQAPFTGWTLNGTCMAIIWSLMEITINIRII